jgi:hypothetical protein
MGDPLKDLFFFGGKLIAFDDGRNGQKDPKYQPR